MLKRILNEALVIIVGFIIFAGLFLVTYYILHFWPVSLEVLISGFIFWVVGTLVMESIRNR